MTTRIGSPDTRTDIELREYLDAEVRNSFIMVGGAGSGKTTSLIKALDHIRKKHGAGLRRRNQQVACITYTEIAVGEIATDVGNNPLFHVSTIHSFLWTLTKPFQKDIAIWVTERIKAKLMELRETGDNFGPRVRQTTREKNEREIAKLEKQDETMGLVQRFTYEPGSDYANGILGHDDVIKMVPQLIKERPLMAKLVAQKYPFFFVDESQDTFAQVVDALKAIAQRLTGTFCLGFFGDPMQQIYVAGVGPIAPDADWKEFTKPENFRCPATVLSAINNVRADGDGLQQTRGRQQLVDGAWQPVIGSARLFILPADEHRESNLKRVRAWLAETNSDAHWMSDAPKADVRILVIVHRMAAARLGFVDLFAAFNDGAPPSFAASFKEGNAWALQPFIDVLLPLSSAVEQDRQVDTIALLRAHCPRLTEDNLRRVEDWGQLLATLKRDVRRLAELMSESSECSVQDVLQFANGAQLIRLDERIKDYVDPDPSDGSENMVQSLTGDQEAEQEKVGDKEREASAMEAYLSCPAKQIRGYYTYISKMSPYSTQQGIKGAEFERVLVVLDDEESRHRQFSYDKLLALREPSKTDLENQSQGRDSILDRTRRLFYVCCSRAKKDLAVVLYTGDVTSAAEHLRAATLFDKANIYTLDDLS